MFHHVISLLIFKGNLCILLIICLFGNIKSQVADEEFIVKLYSGASVADIVIQKDDKIIVAGLISKVNEKEISCGLARLLPNGETDSTFTIDFSGRVHRLKKDTSDRIYISGNFTNGNNESLPYLLRLLPNGHVDEEFNTSYLTETIINFFIRKDQGILITTGTDSLGHTKIIGLDSHGAIDSSINEIPIENSLSHDIIPLKDGIVIIGSNITFNNTPVPLIKYFYNGNIDSAYTTRVYTSYISNSVFGININYCLDLSDYLLLYSGHEIQIFSPEGQLLEQASFQDYGFPFDIKKLSSQKASINFRNALAVITLVNGQFSIDGPSPLGILGYYNIGQQSSGQYIIGNGLHSYDSFFDNISIKRLDRNFIYDTVFHSRLFTDGRISKMTRLGANTYVTVGSFLGEEDQMNDNIMSFDDKGNILSNFSQSTFSSNLTHSPLIDVANYGENILISGRAGMSQSNFQQGLFLTDNTGHLIGNHPINAPDFYNQNFDGGSDLSVTILNNNNFIAYSSTGSIGYSGDGTISGGAILSIFDENGELQTDLREDKGIRCFSLNDIIQDDNNNIYIFGNRTSYNSQNVGNILKINENLERDFSFIAPNSNNNYNSYGVSTDRGLITSSLTANQSNCLLQIRCLDAIGDDCLQYNSNAFTDQGIFGIIPLTNKDILVYGAIKSFNDTPINNHIVLDSLGKMKRQFVGFSSERITDAFLDANILYLSGIFKLSSGHSSSILKFNLAKIITSVSTPKDYDDVRIYPTLTDNGNMHVVISNNKWLGSLIDIFDTTGRKINTKSLIALQNVNYIHISNLLSGAYYMTIYNDHSRKTIKFIAH